MNIKLENEIIAEDEINLYDYWKVLVKRKKIFIGIFLVPLVVVTIISLSVPRYYRGKVEIINPVLPPPNIVNLIGRIDDTKKAKIFTNTPGTIKSVLISLPKQSNDKINITVDAETADIIPQAFKDIFDYISTFPEINREIARVKEEVDLRIKTLVEARKANRVFLNSVTDMVNKKTTSIIVNPADFILKDHDLYLEIMRLQKVETGMMTKRKIKVIGTNLDDLIKKDADQSLEVMNLQKIEKAEETLGLTVTLLITMQPSNSRIKQIILITGLLSFLTGIFVISFLEYIHLIKARGNK